MVTRFNVIASLLICSLLIGSISCQKQTADWGGTIEDVGGVIVVKNPVEPRNPELKIVFEEDLTIGVEEGDESYMFGSEVFVNTDDEGVFYVTDWDKKIIKKYDQEGRYLKSIGRTGQGPGEFQNISEVKFDVNGHIYLNDLANRRISFLNKEGDYIRGIKVPSIFERVIINSKGFYIAQASEILQEEQVTEWDLIYGLFDDEFTIVEELFRLHEKSKGPSGRDEDSIAEFLAEGLSKMAYKPNVNYVLDEEDNILFGYSENYEIKVYSPGGNLMKIIQCISEPVEVSEIHKEDFLRKRGVSFMSAMPQRTHHLKEKIFSLVKFPKYKPAYEQFSLMENGWIFVVVDSALEGHALVDIFDTDGRYLTHFKAGISTDWLSFNNGKAYAVATEGDYKFIKRYSYEVLGGEQ